MKNTKFIVLVVALVMILSLGLIACGEKEATYTEWTIDTMPTIDSEGTATRVKTVGDEETKESLTLPALSDEAYTKTSVKAATCQAEGEDKYTITLSDKEFAVTIKTAKVALVKVDAKAPKPYATGNVEYYKCPVCGTLYKANEASDANKTTLEAVTIAKVVLTHVEAVVPTVNKAGNIEYWLGDDECIYADAEGSYTLDEEDIVLARLEPTRVAARDADDLNDGNIEHYTYTDLEDVLHYYTYNVATDTYTEVTYEDVVIPAYYDFVAKVDATYDTAGTKAHYTHVENGETHYYEQNNMGEFGEVQYASLAIPALDGTITLYVNDDIDPITITHKKANAEDVNYVNEINKSYSDYKGIVMYKSDKLGTANILAPTDFVEYIKATKDKDIYVRLTYDVTFSGTTEGNKVITYEYGEELGELPTAATLTGYTFGNYWYKLEWEKEIATTTSKVYGTMTVTPDYIADGLTFEKINSTACNIIGYTGTNTEVILPYFDADGAEVWRVYGETFVDNKTLKKVVIHEDIREIVGNPFRGCNLDSIVVSDKSMFYSSPGNNMLLYIGQPGSVQLVVATANTPSTIPSNVTKIVEDSFSGVTLESLTIPDSVSVSEFAFIDANIKNMTLSADYAKYAPVTIESLVITGNRSLKSEALMYKPMLKSVYFNDEFAGALVHNLFLEDTSLTNLRLSPNTTAIEGALFANCYSLDSVFIPSSVKTISKDFLNKANKSLVIYTDASREAVATDWNLASWESKAGKVVFDVALSTSEVTYTLKTSVDDANPIIVKGIGVVSLPAPAMESAPADTPYFEGWYTDQACTPANKVGTNYASNTNITLYAKWVTEEAYRDGSTPSRAFKAVDGQPIEISLQKGDKVFVSINTTVAGEYTFAMNSTDSVNGLMDADILDANLQEIKGMSFNGGELAPWSHTFALEANTTYLMVFSIDGYQSTESSSNSLVITMPKAN